MYGHSFLEYAIRNAIVVCPICKSSLSLKWAIRRKGVVQRAELQCASCNVSFKIYARILVLLPPGQFADWTHPLVEAVFGNIRVSYEKLVAKHGIRKIRELYFKLIRGEYRPPKLFFKEPVDRRLLAEGGRRITKGVVEKHLRRIKEQSEGRKDLAEMIRYTLKTGPRKILDMCSGGGFFLARLIEMYRKFEQLFSLDVDYHCAKRVEGTLRYNRLLGRTLPLVADARAMPFNSNYFDVVTNNCGFSQILGYSRALREAFRVLKPGGKMIVRDNQGITKWDSSKLRITIGFTRDELEDIYEYCDICVDKEKFLALAEKIGFFVDRIRDFNKYFVAVLGKPN